jgi:DNA-binding SARP family transcriptional activator
MENPRLAILLLGPPVVTLDGFPLKINRKQQRAGLFYLASQTESVSRSIICELFWPKATEELARKHLREGLSKLRVFLNEPNAILAENDQLFLNPACVYVDAREYNGIVLPLLNSSELNNTGILPDWILSQLRKAMSLCRSNRFLQGISLPESTGYQNWVEYTNGSYEFSRQKIILRMADHYITIGNLDEAILWLGKAIATDPLNTDINYLVLNCLLEKGKSKEALDYIDYLDNLYRTSLDEELPQVLSDFRNRIPGIRAPGNRNSTQDWPLSEKNLPPFVGREDLIQRLNHALHRKGIVMVRGESGSGKTRLVQEFYTRLDFKPRLLFCIGKPMMVSSPFGPLIDGLRVEVKPEEWDSLPEDISGDLALLFPELGSNPHEDPGSLEDANSPEPMQSLYSALHYLFIKLAEKKPLLLVIDITQWCDEATLGFLSFLNYHNFFRKHGLFITISRLEEVNPTLEAYIDRSVLSHNLERIMLPPFSLEETVQLTTALLGRNVSDAFLEKLQNDTGGSPFFLVESLRSIEKIDVDTQKFSSADLYPIPSTVRSMVNEKTALLSKDAKEVLRSAAVLGQHFLPEVLEIMLPMDGEVFVSSLDELQRRAILTADNGLRTFAGYDFPHDQIREVILQEMTPARKRSLHLKAIKALEVSKGEQPELASIYAYHYEQADETVKAFEFWLLAGRFARSRFSQPDTYAAYQRALDLVPFLPAQHVEELVHQLVVEWGDYAYDISDDATCERIYKLCLEMGEKTQSPLLIGTGLSGIGRVAGMRRELEDGIESINRARFFLSKANSKGEELEACARLGVLYSIKNNYPLAREICEIGLELGKNYDDKRALDAAVNIQFQLSFIYIQSGYPAKAEKLASQAFDDSKLINRRSAKVQAMAALALAMFYTAKYKKSLQTAKDAYVIADQLKMRWWISFLELILAKNYLALGELDACWPQVTKALEREAAFPNDKVYSHGHAIFGDIYRLSGDLKRAEDQYRIGAQQPQHSFQTLENMYLLGYTLHDEGQIQEGEKMLTEAIQLSESLGLGAISLLARMVLLLINHSAEQNQELQKPMDDLVTEMKERGFGSSWIMADLIAGSRAFERGEMKNAKVFFEKVALFGQTILNPWLELLAYPALLNISEGDPDEKRRIKSRVDGLLTEMSRNATHKPVNILFAKYRGTWKELTK